MFKNIKCAIAAILTCETRQQTKKKNGFAGRIIWFLREFSCEVIVVKIAFTIQQFVLDFAVGWAPLVFLSVSHTNQQYFISSTARYS